MSNTTPTIQSLFKAGAHFGFSKSRRHPSIASFIFATKDGTDIFDLEQTEKCFLDAQAYMTSLGEAGKTVLVISTKEEIRDIVHASADAANLPYVVNRWIGGVLTNFSEIKKRVQRMVMLKDQSSSGELDRKYTKKERLMLSREVEKLASNFGGIEKMERIPDAVLVVDPRHDHVAVTEAFDARIPIIAIMSSDCDLSKIAKPIPANDAQRDSVQFILSALTSAYSEGKTRYTPKIVKQPTHSERK